MRLEDIKSPQDIKGLSYAEMNDLAAQIRTELVTTISKRGGHLASNLGVVELTMAIHRVFNMPEDKIVFDVGHQSYVHKLLTGRYRTFCTLRSFGGMSGFPKRSESEYDVVETGHASTALSAALGLARARDLQGQHHHVLALVGDGAMTGGMCYEALNDAGDSHTRMIVILNDNEMSIAAERGGAFAAPDGSARLQRVDKHEAGHPQRLVLPARSRKTASALFIVGKKERQVHVRARKSRGILQ